MSDLEGQIIAVDFDGTVLTHEYPELGKEIGAAPVLLRLVESGAKLILWTMRSGEPLVAAVAWFESHGIELWAVNHNPQQKHWTDSRKAYANLYIDDAALGCPLVTPLSDGTRPYVDWVAVELLLFPKAIKRLQRKAEVEA